MQKKSWECICRKVKQQLQQKQIQQRMCCKNCIWADTESGKIFCTRNPCVKLKELEEKQK